MIGESKLVFLFSRVNSILSLFLYIVYTSRLRIATRSNENDENIREHVSYF